MGGEFLMVAVLPPRADQISEKSAPLSPLCSAVFHSKNIIQPQHRAAHKESALMKTY